jgi:hypothetical protein
MTKTELLRALEGNEAKFHANRARLEQRGRAIVTEYYGRRDNLLKQWVADNNNFAIGDIILANGYHGVVIGMRGVLNGEPKIMYKVRIVEGEKHIEEWYEEELTRE